MSSTAAPRCHHIKVNGTQCGSPALRDKKFCFYHQKNRPLFVECYYEQSYALGDIELPVFEDAYSIQTTLRQVVQMVMQKRLERKTASLVLYALQIATSNLKRMALEKPQPAEVVTDPEIVAQAAPERTSMQGISLDEDDDDAQAPATAAGRRSPLAPKKPIGTKLPPGTIQACCEREPRMPNPPSPNGQRKKQYVI